MNTGMTDPWWEEAARMRGRETQPNPTAGVELQMIRLSLKTAKETAKVTHAVSMTVLVGMEASGMVDKATVLIMAAVLKFTPGSMRLSTASIVSTSG